MNGLFDRSRLTILGLFAIAAAVVFAAVTVPDPDQPEFVGPDWNPCQQVFNLESSESRLGWFFAQTNFPSELVALGSGPSQNCSYGFGPGDQDFAVHFVFFEGEGDARHEAVWWLLYQPWEDPYQYGSRLRQIGGGDVEYFDGYVVAFSPDASDEIREAARTAPDTDIWSVMYERAGDYWATLPR